MHYFLQPTKSQYNSIKMNSKFISALYYKTKKDSAFFVSPAALLVINATVIGALTCKLSAFSSATYDASGARPGLTLI